MKARRVLVTGWFSFERGEATAGDLEARDVACSWLAAAGHAYDVATAGAFADGVRWWAVDPGSYSHLVFVCGPARGGRIDELLVRFAACRAIGLDVSITDGDDGVRRFDALLERDGLGPVRPDLSYLASPAAVPLVGLVRSHPQPEYGPRAMHAAAHAALYRALKARNLCVVAFDTRVDPRAGAGSGTFRSPGEVESFVSRLDVVATTRMHGLVHALKHGIPALAVDPISGGAKVLAQATAVGWPAALAADRLSDASLDRELDFCLSPAARLLARACGDRAREELQLRLQPRFLELLT